MRMLLATVPLIMMLAGCDNRPINAFAALPDEGAALPQFERPALDKSTLSSSQLRGTPAFLALWSTNCPHSVEALRTIEDLRARYESAGVRFAILADNSLDELRTFAEATPVETLMVAFDGTLADTFDQSESAPRSEDFRVMFALPSFLVIDADGRVVRRVGGMLDTERIVSALDALQGPQAP